MYSPRVNERGIGGGERRPLPHAFRIAQVLVVLVVTGVAVAVVKSPWVNSHVYAHVSDYASLNHRLAGYEPDRIDPAFHTEIDVDAFRRAGRALPPGGRYFMVVPARPLVYTDVLSATRIYAPWAIPVSDAAKADWVIAYDAPLPRVGRGYSTVRTWGSFLYLGHVKR
jgi:hypothetical protein